jgi:hypothetical protein
MPVSWQTFENLVDQKGKLFQTIIILLLCF